MSDDDRRLAEICLELGRPKQATHLLTDFLSTYPSDAYALRLMARACLGTRASRAALDWARKATILEPGNDWGWRLVASAASANGDHEVALAAVQKARGLAPENWLNQAQRVQVDLAGHRYMVTEDTWDAAHEAMVLAPDEPDAFLIGATLAKSRGYLDGARSFAAEAQRLAPDDPRPKALLASLRLDSNDMAGAAVSFLSLAASSPGSRRYAAGLRRAVLRTLEWVNGILLVTLIVIGLLAVLGSVTEGSKAVDHGLLVVTLLLAFGGLGLAWRTYRRGLGDSGSDLFRSLPQVAPSLLVLATFQAIVLVATAVMVILIVISLPVLGPVLALSTIVAAGVLFACLVFAGALHVAH